MNSVSALGGLFADWYWRMDGAAPPHLHLAPVRREDRPRPGRRLLGAQPPPARAPPAVPRLRDPALRRRRAAACGSRSAPSRCSTRRAPSRATTASAATSRRRSAASRSCRLEHAVARALAQAGGVAEGLQGGLRAICDIEGWDYGRCFRVDPASGEISLRGGLVRARAGDRAVPRAARAPPGRKASRCSRSRRATRAGPSPPSPSPRSRRAGPSACSRFPGTAPASPTSACSRRRRRSAACSASSCSASRPRRCCARARRASAA